MRSETYFLDKIPVLSFINELEVLSGAYFFPEELSKISVFTKGSNHHKLSP